MFDNLTDQEKVRFEKLTKLSEKNIEAFGSKKHINSNSSKIKKLFNKFSKEELVNKTSKKFSLMGRIIAKRGQGKAGFFIIQDPEGTLQVYIRKDIVGDDAFELYLNSDMGDIVCVQGFPMKTNTGELSLKIDNFEHVVKCLKPIPNQFYGLKDIENRYRKRYTDLIVNPEVKNIFITRSKIIKEIRLFLDNLNCIEVETPILHPILGGAAAEPFITHHNALSRDFYLRVAPELYLKRLIVGGFEGVYEIGKLFRNEGISIKHNPEFTSMEVYIRNKDMFDMMELTEKLIINICNKMNLPKIINYSDQKIDLSEPWKKYKMVDLIKKYSSINFNEINSDKECIKLANEHDIVLKKHENTISS